MEGINKRNPDRSYEYIQYEIEILGHSVSEAKPYTYITALCDVIDNAIEVVQSYLDKDKDFS